MKKTIAAALLLALLLPFAAPAEEASPQAYALSPLPIRVALGRAAYAREASRYDAALAALGDTENQAVFP
ncbi:MAG TPA: hypothetical protein VLA21_06345, partial [Candidatus Limnocylindria bacterium]|nr:hypothetical protein [Candidatus Limnocylindria bacterium]